MQISILFFSILLPVLGKRRFFCNYLCPMGAIQEIFSKILNRKKINMANKKIKGVTLSEIYLVILWGAILIGFIPDNLSNFEPFMAIV